MEIFQKTLKGDSSEEQLNRAKALLQAVEKIDRSLLELPSLKKTEEFVKTNSKEKQIKKISFDDMENASKQIREMIQYPGAYKSKKFLNSTQTILDYLKAYPHWDEFDKRNAWIHVNSAILDLAKISKNYYSSPLPKEFLMRPVRQIYTINPMRATVACTIDIFSN